MTEIQINKVILDKLENCKSSIGTLTTILFGIHVNADPKIFRGCKDEIAELVEFKLIEIENYKPSLVHPFFQKDAPVIDKKPKESTVDVSKAKVPVSKNDVRNWIHDWREIFPSHKKDTGLNYLLRGDGIECEKRMRDFLKVYRYSKDTIFSATQYYIKEQKAKGWAYTKKAHKFIKDKDGSILSEYCELIETGEITKDKDSFLDVV